MIVLNKLSEDIKIKDCNENRYLINKENVYEINKCGKNNNSKKIFLIIDKSI